MLGFVVLVERKLTSEIWVLIFLRQEPYEIDHLIRPHPLSPPTQQLTQMTSVYQKNGHKWVWFIEASQEQQTRIPLLSILVSKIPSSSLKKGSIHPSDIKKLRHEEINSKTCGVKLNQGYCHLTKGMAKIIRKRE